MGFVELLLFVSIWMGICVEGFSHELDGGKNILVGVNWIAWWGS